MAKQEMMQLKIERNGQTSISYYRTEADALNTVRMLVPGFKRSWMSMGHVYGAPEGVYINLSSVTV